MSNSSKSLFKLVNNLPPHFHKEVKDFVENLMQKKDRKTSTTLCQDWAGALKDYKNKYTSLELQKKALEWRD